MIAVLVPSRGRPDRALAMTRSVLDTAIRRVAVVVIVDADDPSLEEYRAQPWPGRVELRVLEERLGYTASLNRIAREWWMRVPILGAFGDDVAFRTMGWDLEVRRVLRRPGIAFGDDLVHGKNHPTAVFMHTAVARALGWLALPATSHQWADDGWKRLGEETGLLRFMPDVVLEHLHPAVGKAPWDDTYASVFDEDRARRDYEGFGRWLEEGLKADVRKVSRIR